MIQRFKHMYALQCMQTQKSQTMKKSMGTHIVDSLHSEVLEDTDFLNCLCALFFLPGFLPFWSIQHKCVPVMRLKVDLKVAQSCTHGKKEVASTKLSSFKGLPNQEVWKSEFLKYTTLDHSERHIHGQNSVHDFHFAKPPCQNTFSQCCQYCHHHFLPLLIDIEQS
jgi:hypothetical protein